MDEGYLDHLYFRLMRKKRAYLEMNKALDLYEDIYGQWRTYFELWRFNFIDDKIKDAQKYSEKLIRLQPDILNHIVLSIS